MRLLAALLTGVAVYLATSVLTGHAPTIRRARSSEAARERRQWLLQAGVELSPRQFYGGSLLLGALTFATVLAITATPAVAFAPAVAAGLMPRALLARRRTRRLRSLQEAWPDGIRDLIASISAGASLHQAVLSLTEHGPETLRTAFARYPALARVLGVTAALEVVKEDLADPTSDRVIEILILAHERGGALLGDILRDLAAATTRDVRALEQATTDSLEQRINAKAVFVLPWIVLLLLTAQDGYFRDFYRSPGGLIVVAIGALMSLGGFALVSRLSRDPIETRVFGSGEAEG
ncbi:MAG: hypothetical protein R3343_13015 [Nitriliruptorales bacterium]|nr:hypothetical protein [Nitriliruptorales bacterium]